LAVAASYLGSTCTWHAGLSGSAPLIMATPKNFMEAQAGLVPVSTTTFSWFNLTLTAPVLAGMTGALPRLYAREADVRPSAPLLLDPGPASFTAAAMRGATHLHGIVIQFPCYAGMYGLIRYSGLAEIIGRWFVSIASAKTFPVFIYWYSGILSYFIPSGG